MSQSHKFNEFYEALQGISLINSKLDEKRSLLQHEVYNFNTLIQSKKIDNSISKQNKEMAQLLEETIGLIKLSSNSWVNNFEDMLEKEKFRSDLANYFIIIIFGKVKAGKSSLGNFIANHRLDNQEVDFFKYDEAGKKQNIKKLQEIDAESEFATNNLECTVQIQGFTLAGMAWVDTPGLGSMVKENGDLARDYIQSADYIIYPTSSDATMDMSEEAQLKELFEQNKKVTICITKSDEKEEDECECGSEDGCFNCTNGIITTLVNKSGARRLEQEKHVKVILEKIVTKNKNSVLGNVFSISAHTAKLGLLEEDDQLFENSNIPEFYNLMTEVVKNKSAKLKEDAPYDGLDSFIQNSILGNNESQNNNSIKSIERALDLLDRKIQESIERFAELKENANSDLETAIENIVAEYACKINNNNSKELFNEIDAKLNVKVPEAVKKNIFEIFEDFEVSLTNLTTTFGASDFEIKDKYQTVEYTTETRNKKIGAGLFALAASIGVGVVTGGASLLVQAGATIAAGAAGSYLGGKAGEATGSNQTERIKVGNNAEEVIQKFKSNRLEHYENFAKSLYQQVEDTFFIPIQETSKEISADIEQFSNKIQKIL